MKVPSLCSNISQFCVPLSNSAMNRHLWSAPFLHQLSTTECPSQRKNKSSDMAVRATVTSFCRLEVIYCIRSMDIARWIYGIWWWRGPTDVRNARRFLSYFVPEDILIGIKCTYGNKEEEDGSGGNNEIFSKKRVLVVTP